MPHKDLHQANRASWNAATKQHNTHKGDQAKSLREGGTTLYADDVELLGDLTGKNLLHLQCNSGQDTLSIAKHLNASVTGVDISDEAIDFATQLSADSGIPGTFIRSDIYDFFEQNADQFDVVFASYGTLSWLSDLTAWGSGIAAALKPGGRFVMVEFHPVYNLFESEGGEWKLRYDYMGGTHYTFDGIGDYVAECGVLGTERDDESPDWQNPHPSHEFTWGIADVVMGLVGAGLHLTFLREYPHTNGFRRFDEMRALPGGEVQYTMPADMPTLPLMFGIVAAKS